MKKLTAKQTAKELLKFYGDGSKWTRKAFARDKETTPVLEESKKAVQWCMEGACNKLQIDWHPLATALGVKNLWGVNDSQKTFNGIRKVLEKV